MNPNLLTHLVPVLPPHDGISGECALNLGRQLRDRHGIDSQFIICDPEWDGPTRIDNFIIRRLRYRNEAGLWSLLASIKENPKVLLHYDAYAYDEHGVPSWLYQGIKSWICDGNGGMVLDQKQFSVIFHELGALSTKPWQTKFYIQSLQKRLIKKLHRRSHVSIATSKLAQINLDAIKPQKSLLMPTPDSFLIFDRIIRSNQCDLQACDATHIQLVPQAKSMLHSKLILAVDKNGGSLA